MAAKIGCTYGFVHTLLDEAAPAARRDIERLALLHQGYDTGTLHDLATTRSADSIDANSAYIIGRRRTACAHRPGHPPSHSMPPSLRAVSRLAQASAGIPPSQHPQ
ncbi:hypothetical protein ACWKSP_06180 [Micromonosporaceae bacterium Da 78-11]